MLRIRSSSVPRRLGRLPSSTALGGLHLQGSPEELVPQQRRLHRVDTLPITEDTTLQVGKLPDLHRDPFDRLLVAQAIVGGLTIVTPDRLIKAYPVPTLWK